MKHDMSGLTDALNELKLLFPRDIVLSQVREETTTVTEFSDHTERLGREGHSQDYNASVPRLLHSWRLTHDHVGVSSEVLKDGHLH